MVPHGGGTSFCADLKPFIPARPWARFRVVAGSGLSIYGDPQSTDPEGPTVQLLGRIDAATGNFLGESVLDDRDPGSGEDLQKHVKGLNMPVALPDILSSDGKYVYMRSLPFDLQGKRKFVTYVPVDEQQGDDLHLFCPTGFLDDSLWHRTYWGYGRAWASGAGGYHQAGRVIPEIGEILNDDHPGRTSETEITLLRSLGLAVEDIASAELVYRRALEGGFGTHVDLVD